MGEKEVEMPGIEPGAFHMQSERSTTELHPLSAFYGNRRRIIEVRRYLEHTNSAKQLKYPRGDSNPQSSV